MNSKQLEIFKSVWRHWEPPPDLSISEWADQFRYLSPEASAEPGRWDTSRAEYQREIMDEIKNDDYDTVVFMKCVQVGATEIVNNICGYFIDQEPAPIMVLQPTEEMANTWSKDRFSPMLRDSKNIKGKIKQTKTSNNTIRHKSFPGGHITVAISNSPASIASRPIKVCLQDEVDRYPKSAGSEGDPSSIAFMRTTTYPDAIKYMCSTPTIRDHSRIEAAYLASDQRRFYVPCINCGKYQVLEWKNVVWEKDGETGEHLYQTAIYRCPFCKEELDDAKRYSMVKRGEWRKTSDKQTNVAGFHINAIYSPWVKLQNMVKAWLAAQGDPEKLKTFVNLWLGETWEETGETVEHHELMQRIEKYPAPVPAGGLVLVASFDVQKDRLEGEVKAYGLGFESWSIEYIKIYGNLAMVEPWQRLDDYLTKEFQHESGLKLKISCTTIDSGGMWTDEVYKFCKGKEHRRIFAIKGANTPAKPLISNPTKSNKAKIKLFTIGTDTAKETIYGRLKITQPGPGFMHFPDSYDDAYFEGLTSEKGIPKYKNGTFYRQWVKKSSNVANEPLDVNVYSLAAVSILNPDMRKLSFFMQKKIEDFQKEDTPDPPAKTVPQKINRLKKKNLKRNWVNAWNK